MNDQYFSREPTAASQPVRCVFVYRGFSFRMMTDSGVFSKGELDEGTRLLLDALPPLTGNVLDLGCGWGAIGTAVAKANPEAIVTMTDVNLRALALAEQNAAAHGCKVRCLESDGLSALQGERFDCIITNPPIRAGKQVIYRLFAEAAAALQPTGSLWLVIRKQQGADSAMKYLAALFGSVEIISRSKGFRVLRASKPVQAASDYIFQSTHASL